MESHQEPDRRWNVPPPAPAGSYILRYNYIVMASSSEQGSEGMFECHFCGLAVPYNYVGQKPPNSRTVVLLEESYVRKDPFSSDRDKFLVLGSRCSLCRQLACVGPECSLFYTKRFCLPCVRENLSAFPQEIRQDVEKRHTLSKAASKKLDSRT